MRGDVRLTLYRNPDITFGGAKVGGIEISHMSHLDKPLTLALTRARGKRTPFTVQASSRCVNTFSNNGTPAQNRIAAASAAKAGQECRIRAEDSFFIMDEPALH